MTRVWWPPKTWAAAETPTPAKFNSYVSDAENLLITGCRVATYAGYVFPDGASAAVVHLAALFDPLGMWNAADPTKVTIPHPGTYAVAAAAGGVNSAGATGLRVTKNGDTLSSGVTGTGTVALSVPLFEFQLAAGDVLELLVTPAGGTFTFAANLLGDGSYTSWLDVDWVGP